MEKRSEIVIHYIQVGDYYIPDISLPQPSKPIGKWGRLYRDFLKNHHPVRYNTLILSGQLWDLLGKATGAEDQAEALLAYNEQTKTELAELLEGAQRPVVYLAGNSSYLSTAGAKMYQNTLIEMGGGENAAAQLEDNYWAEVSYEQLLAWNPDAIVIVPEASYTKEDLMNDVQLAQLDAVKNDAVYEMPSAFEAWDSPVPSAMLGSRWMAAVLHEAAYSFQTFCDDAAAFYKDFYGIDIDTALLTK